MVTRSWLYAADYRPANKFRAQSRRGSYRAEGGLPILVSARHRCRSGEVFRPGRTGALEPMYPIVSLMLFGSKIRDAESRQVNEQSRLQCPGAVTPGGRT